MLYGKRLEVYATWLINYLWHYWEKWSEETKMNNLNQNKFQAGRNCSEAVQLPPGWVMELLLLVLFKINPEQWGMMKHEQFFFFLNMHLWTEVTGGSKNLFMEAMRCKYTNAYLCTLIFQVSLRCTSVTSRIPITFSVDAKNHFGAGNVFAVWWGCSCSCICIPKAKITLQGNMFSKMDFCINFHFVWKTE